MSQNRTNHRAPSGQASQRLRAIVLACLLSLLLLPMVLADGCGVSASAGSDSLLDQQQAASSTGTVPPQFFGMVVKAAAATPLVAVGSRRLWDAGVTWAALEPQRGSFSWQALDAAVDAAEQQGEQVVLTLGMTPTWASSQPTLPSAYGDGATAMPSNMEDWDAYVTAVATRYAGRIRGYEIWNAPENPAYWSGDPGEMGIQTAELAEEATGCIHSIDPYALVVSPGLSPAGLGQFLAAGGSRSIDVVAGVLNLQGQAPEAAADQLRSLRAAMVGTAAAGKPLWNDQAAWTLPSTGLSEATQAAWVARALLLNAGFGVARMHWYAWDDSVAGTLRLSSGTQQPTAALLAYGVVEDWLSGNAMNGCSSTAEELWTCQLVIGGIPAWVVWAAGNPVNASTYGASTETDLSGNVHSIGSAQTLPVGESPVLLQ
jgi:hypothetical protein